MASKRKRTLEELVSSGEYKIIDRGLAWVLLSNVDVQDAMKFADAVGVDSRFQQIINVLRENAIWEFWFQRDLEIFKPIMPWKEKRGLEIEAPEWKTYYLWMRLAMTCYQWIAINYFTEKILSVYPPGSALRLIRLNELELTVFGKSTIMLDFRKQFPRFAPHSQYYRSSYPLPKWQYGDLWYLEVRMFFKRDSPYVSFLNTFFPRMTGQAVNWYAEILHAVIDKSISIIDASDVSNMNIFDYVPFPDWSILTRPPRIVEETKLMVASPISRSITCSWCVSKPAALYEADRLHIGYCSEKCQDKLYNMIEAKQLQGPQDALDENLSAIVSTMESNQEKDDFIIAWEIQRRK